MSRNEETTGKYTEAEYKAFFERIQEKIDINDLTPSKIKEWMRNDKLADNFALSRQIYLLSQRATSLEELNQLKEDSKTLLINKDKVLKLIDSRMETLNAEFEERRLAQVITLTQNLAQRKRITLNERARGGRYENWGRYHRPAIVIFKNGKIKSWEYIKQ